MENGPPPYSTQCLKRDGRRCVWRVDAPGRPPSVMKVWPLQVGLVLKMLLGLAQPQRLRRDAELLLAAGLPTPPVDRRWTIGRDNDGRVLGLTMPWIPGVSGLEALKRSADPSMLPRVREAATQAGSIVAAHAGAGVVNRDLKLTNLIVDGLDGGTTAAVHVSVIDPDLRRARSRPAAIARMLERLNIEPADFGVSVPWSVHRAAVRAATCDRGRADRRAVLRMLRSRRPR
ncbi:MAG: BUD32 family EKC/KEOPS complex subunit [Planctomycetota bacterium]